MNLNNLYPVLITEESSVFHYLSEVKEQPLNLYRYRYRKNYT